MALWKLHSLTGLTFHFCVRGFLSLVDVGNALLIGDIARRAWGAPRGVAALAYALNPVAIFIVGFHGQFDNLAALPVLAGLRLVLAPDPPALRLVWALGTAGLCVKHLNVFTVLALLVVAGGTFLRSAGLFAGSLAVFAASFVPYLPRGLEGIVENVFLYRGMGHPYGLGVFVPRPLLFVVFVAVLAATPFLARRVLGTGPAETLELTTVALLVFIPGIGEAYFVLPVLFGSARRSLGWAVYTVVGYYFVMHGPNNVQAIPGPQPWTAIWLALVFWLVLDVVRAVRNRRGPGPLPAAA